MKKLTGLSFWVLYLTTASCHAQQAATAAPDAPSPQVTAPVHRLYTPPSQRQRFRIYVRSTYGLYSLIEAGIRGGIGQARDSPSQWPEGAEGFADRYGSAMGDIAVRGTTEYVVADLFHEDIRPVPADSARSAFTRALEDTFTARKGSDGHRTFSVARFLGPIASGVVMKETWYPSGYSDNEIVREAGVDYGFTFVRSYVWELIH